MPKSAASSTRSATTSSGLRHIPTRKSAASEVNTKSSMGELKDAKSVGRNLEQVDSAVLLDRGIEAQGAEHASKLEHEMTTMQAIKSEWRAVLWSVVISMSVVMQGYDNSLIGNFFGYPAFKENLGNFYPGIGYQISKQWQAALPNGATIGIIIGAFMNGYLSPRFGYKRVTIVSLVFMTGFIFIAFFASSVQVLLVAELFCGINLYIVY